MNINTIIKRPNHIDTSIRQPESMTKIVDIKEEELPIDIDYIEVMQPSAKIVREFFREIAEELNKTIWK